MSSSPWVADSVKAIVRPFVDGTYVEDWRQRAARVGAIADYCLLRIRDNPLFELDDQSLGARFGSKAVLRTRLHEAFDEAMGSSDIGYSFPMRQLEGDELSRFRQCYGGVDSVEKMAMSAVAHAICHLDPPPLALLLLCNQFYEEALHLEALSTLFAIDQSQEAWITEKRRPFWSYARSAETLWEYAIVQNCLSEGEGAIAAAEIRHALRDLPADSPALLVAERITVEECSHALLGYTLLSLAGSSLDRSMFDRTLAAHRVLEPLRDESSAKGRRQRFAAAMLEDYVETRGYWSVERRLLTAVHACRALGAYE